MPILGFSHARAGNPSFGLLFFDPNPYVQRNILSVFRLPAKPSAKADFLGWKG
jgi:hypothetical protein